MPARFLLTHCDPDPRPAAPGKSERPWVRVPRDVRYPAAPAGYAWWARPGLVVLASEADPRESVLGEIRGVVGLWQPSGEILWHATSLSMSMRAVLKHWGFE